MNKRLLNSLMAENEETQTHLANLLQLSLSRLNAKINETNGAQFNQSEIRILKEHYELNASQVDAIFFAF